MEATPTGKLVWFDFAVKDETKAMKFYKDLFAWNFEPAGNNYWMIKVENNTIGGIRKEASFTPCTGMYAYFNVPSITEAKSILQKAGGKVTGETMPIDGGKMGYSQNFTDLDGNILALWSMKN